LSNKDAKIIELLDVILYANMMLYDRTNQ
jgi:hypothetical protein